MVVWPSRPPCLPRLPPGEFRPGLKFWPAFRAGGCTEEGNGGAAEGQKVHPGGRQAWAWVPCAPRAWTLALQDEQPEPHPSPTPPPLPLYRTRLGLGEPEGTEGAPQNRHVGLPVPAARLPGPLGGLRRLDRFCDCGGQRGCEPHRRLPLYQLRDWGVGKWPNQLILWTGLLCALGTSVVGNFQQKNQLPTHLTGAFFAFFVGNLYFWLQLLLFWRMRGLPQPGAPWIGPLRLGLCGLCTILMVASILAGAESGQFFPRTRMDAGSRGTRIPSGEQIRTEGRGEGEDLEGEEQGVGDTRTDGPVRPDLLSHPNQPVPPLPHPTP
ncbi:modulator of macroautophagy TMEM150B isoform X4 [Manis javanica]|uniref:modulator of macroautophagy TMEM150B isoform X4 n=1 Tax=Manis javanica TaxID=9974 RepID=UPI003C6CD84E